MRSNSGRCVAFPWYLGGMKFDSRVRDLRTLPLYSSGEADAQLSRDQLTELERRREFIRSRAARNRVDGNGEEIDPVLAFHLGLKEGDRR
jgi:hypothetical protein